MVTKQQFVGVFVLSSQIVLYSCFGTESKEFERYLSPIQHVSVCQAMTCVYRAVKTHVYLRVKLVQCCAVHISSFSCCCCCFTSRCCKRKQPTPVNLLDWTFLDLETRFVSFFCDKLRKSIFRKLAESIPAPPPPRSLRKTSSESVIQMTF